MINRNTPTFSLVLALAFAATLQAKGESKQRTFTHIAPDGSERVFIADADPDGDGISSVLEQEGYYYCRATGEINAAHQLCDGVRHDTIYKTDPDRWSSDGDPYSDYTEVTGVNMHSAVTVPENHPLVASSPNIVVRMLSYNVTPNGDITDTEGGSQSQSYTNETSSSVEVSVSETVEASASLTDLGVSASMTVSASSSQSVTNSSTSSSEMNWSQARTVNPSEAAYLSLNIFMENTGSAPLINVEMQFNIVLGGKAIATVTPSETINSLAPGERFPEQANSTIVVEYDHNNNKIPVTLEELKALQLGAPLTLEVTQVDGNVGRWDPETKTFANNDTWKNWKANIDPVVMQLHADLGNGESHVYKIYAGTAKYNPNLTFRDLVSTVFPITKVKEEERIANRSYPGQWYMSTPSQEVQNEWNNLGRPETLWDVLMHRQTVISMKSPGANSKPKVNLASFNPDFKNVLVSLTPGAFPVLSAKAVLHVNDELKQFPLIKKGAFYTMDEDLKEIAQPKGKVIVENSKGDTTVQSIVLPAYYTSAEDVIAYSNFLPLPGGDEYLLFINGDTTKPATIYCDFQIVGDDTVGTEYLTLSTTDSTNFSEQPYRANFNKIAVDINSLRVEQYDINFAEYSGDQEVKPKYGHSIQSCSGHSGNIDLRDTPFHISHNTLFTGNQVFVSENRKVANWYGGQPQSCIEAGIDHIFTLEYDTDKDDFTASPDLSQGSTASLNLTDTTGGYFNFGVQPSLEMKDALTIEAWVHPTVKNDKTQLLLNREGEYELFRWEDGTLRWAIANTSPGWRSINTHYIIPINKWTHIALTYEKDGKILVYINGDLYQSFQGLGSIGDHSTHVNQDEFWVGSRQHSPQNVFTGLIDEVRIWNIVRTQEEIQNSIHDVLGPDVYENLNSGLQGYWRFDQFEDLLVGQPGVNDIRDYSPNANHGEQVGDAKLQSDVTTLEPLSIPPVKPQFQSIQNLGPSRVRVEFTVPGFKVQKVRLQVYGAHGKLLKTLVDSDLLPGDHIADWVRPNITSGFYFYKLTIGKSHQIQRYIQL